MSENPDAEGFVLAGGRSTRMGAEKALVRLAGEPLVVHALRTLRQAGLTVSIAGAHVPLGTYAPVVADTEPGHGPLGGICSALAVTAAVRAVFLPVDLPLLPSALIGFLLEKARKHDAAITLFDVSGFMQTFPAVIDRAALPILREALRNGRAKCLSAFQAAAQGLARPMQIIPLEQAFASPTLECAPLLRDCWFLNVNEPADLARAEACLSHTDATTSSPSTPAAPPPV